MNTELQTMNNVYANLQSVIMKQGIAALTPKNFKTFLTKNQPILG